MTLIMKLENYHPKLEILNNKSNRKKTKRIIKLCYSLHTEKYLCLHRNYNFNIEELNTYIRKIKENKWLML